MCNRLEHQKLNQTTAWQPSGWVFGVQVGLQQTQALIKTKTIRRGKVPPASLLLRSNLLLSSNVAGGTFPLIVLVLISACVCLRPSWTPKTQPNDSSAVVWLSFWCSTRFTWKKCLSQWWEICRLHSYIWNRTARTGSPSRTASQIADRFLPFKMLKTSKIK